jgi:hypothetical protein
MARSDPSAAGRASAGGSAGNAAGSGDSPESAASNTSTAEPDTTSPAVIGSTPADGARGVASDARIEVSFSESMDTDATQAAYASVDLPSDSVSFSWQNRDTLLVIQPREPMPIASGTDAAEVSAKEYSFALSTRATDLAGNALVPLSVSFSVARQISQTLGALTDRTLTGSWREDGLYGVLDCSVEQATVCVGESTSLGEPVYRGFLTFDLSALPTDRLAIIAAELSITVSIALGEPFATMGALELEKVSFDEIGATAYEQAAETSLGVLSTGATAGDTLSADVLAAVQADAAAGRRSQYRLGFVGGSDADITADVLVCELSSAHLKVSYTLR